MSRAVTYESFAFGSSLFPITCYSLFSGGGLILQAEIQSHRFTSCLFMLVICGALHVAGVHGSKTGRVYMPRA